MKKQSVYTPLNADDIGAFREDALTSADAADALSVRCLVDAMMADLLGSMRRLAKDDARRKEVERMLV